MYDILIWFFDGAEAFAPPYIIRAGIAVVNILVCLGVYAAFGGFTEQGAVLLSAEPGSVIRNGVIAYFVGVALVLMLSLTIVLLPIAAIFVLAGIAMLVIGQASFSMLIGLVVGRRMGKRLSPLVCLIVGLGGLQIIINIPYIGLAAFYLFLPILSLGLTLTAVINGAVKKRFYYAPFKKVDRKRDFDRAAMREIIKGEDTN
jgi:hypothetical protein